MMARDKKTYLQKTWARQTMYMPMRPKAAVFLSLMTAIDNKAFTGNLKKSYISDGGKINITACFQLFNPLRWVVALVQIAKITLCAIPDYLINPKNSVFAKMGSTKSRDHCRLLMPMFNLWESGALGGKVAAVLTSIVLLPLYAVVALFRAVVTVVIGLPQELLKGFNAMTNLAVTSMVSSMVKPTEGGEDMQQDRTSSSGSDSTITDFVKGDGKKEEATPRKDTSLDDWEKELLDDHKGYDTINPIYRAQEQASDVVSKVEEFESKAEKSDKNGPEVNME